MRARLCVSSLILCGACFSPTDVGGTASGTDTSTATDTPTTDPSDTVDPSITDDPTDATTTSPSTTTPVDTSSSDTDPETTGPTPEGCGNDQMDPGESCDDGNTESGDGCSAACQDEAAFCDPRVVGVYDNSSDAIIAVTQAGDYVVTVSDSFNPAVVVLDITEPDEPLFTSAYNLTSTTAVSIIGRSDRVLVVGDPLVTGMSLAADGSIDLVAQIDGSNEYPFGGVLQGTTLYIANDANTRVINTADLSNMAPTGGGLSVPGVMFPSYDAVAASSTGAFVSVGGLLGAFDISDPGMPSLQGTVSYSGGGGLIASDDGGFVYARSSTGMAVIDVGDLADPQVRGGGAIQDGTTARDVATRGSFVYVSGSDGDITAFDATDPDAPALAHELDVGADPAIAMHTGEDYLLVVLGGTVHFVADLPGYCEAVCGNGVTEYPEQCDDGDLESGDECDADCTT